MPPQKKMPHTPLCPRTGPRFLQKGLYDAVPVSFSLTRSVKLLLMGAVSKGSWVGFSVRD
jgi:hypothetical protein